MKQLTPRTAVTLALDVILLAVCIWHIPYLLQRARLPFEADEVLGRVVVVRILDAQAAGEIRPGDHILRWGNDSISIDHQLEFLSDFRAVSDTVRLTVQGILPERQAAVTMVPFYGVGYVVIILLVGIVTWCVGVFILLARPRERAAGALQWSLVCMGISVLLAWGPTPPGDLFPLVSRAAFFIVYTGVGSVFLFFTTLFPRPRYGSVPRKAALIFIPAAVVLAVLLLTHLRALAARSVMEYGTFHGWYDAFQVMKLVFVAGGLYNVVHSYRAAESTVERKRMQWMLWGLAIGPAPFLLLVTVPELFFPSGLVPEEATLIFLIIIPLAFAISFVKYRLLDIEVVIKRTTVYGVVLASILVVYVGVVWAISALIGAYVQGASVAASVIIALLFEPARRSVQRLVDRRFFRVQYVFREAGRKFLADIERAVDEHHLGALLVHRMHEVIPVHRIGVFVFTEQKDRLRLLAHEGFDELQRRSVHFDWEHLKTSLRQPVAVAGSVEPGVEIVGADPEVFRRWRMTVAFPIPGERAAVLGFLVLGGKKSDARFTAEDIDLLEQVAAESGLALERIVLQRRLLLEQAVARRLEELNRMKSDFVSYVSHELRTPLTSIKMFAEMLARPGMRLGRSARDHVRIIEGEADRLGRMVTTILDSARIEQGVQEYALVRTDLVPIIRKAMQAMAFQLGQGRFTVRTVLPRSAVLVRADPDAVGQAIVNLVANAVKYSAERKELTVRLARSGRTVRCSIRDRGRGIPSESIPHLFERFYRDPSVKRKVQGVGLGLPLVRHIMEAHQGSIEVASAVGKGSTFTLVFPLPTPGGTDENARTENRP